MLVKDTKHWQIVQSKRIQVVKESWSKVGLVLKSLVKQFAQGSPFKWADCKGIYAMPRGGNILGTALSNVLHMPMLLAPTDNCVIVDDIVDSGRQLESIYQQYIKINTGMLLVWYINEKRTKYLQRTNVGYYKIVRGKTWVSFPWEDL